MKQITSPAIERAGRVVSEAPRIGLARFAAPHKWRDLSDPLKICAKRFRLNSTDIHFLETLLSFVPDDHLTLDPTGRLIVFASNAAIARRMGLSGDSTVNRCIRRAEDRGFVQRIMSPNRKRYRRVGQGGQTLHSYGIDIGPLVAGHERLRMIADEVLTEAADIEALHCDCADELGRLRRILDKASTVSAAMLETMKDFTRRLRRVPVLDLLSTLLDEIREAIDLWKTPVKDTNDPARLSDAVAHSERRREHNQNISIDEAQPKTELTEAEIARALPTLSAILAEKKGAREIMGALNDTAKLLPNSDRAWSYAVSTLGPMQAAVLLGFVIERGEKIVNHGGYLRRLVDLSKHEHLSPIELLRRNPHFNGSRHQTSGFQ
ncbi:replication initiation protein RepC [Aliiruegeria sabulilitoris]|uniref:replication initiation protein RepC n=1 Tax=Aliiruegeria sabulilitoris TaxID=1510458 RepID=UPI0008311987|nr:replication initiation protein RepC [Aliiruegeria sabulilitoris]NDR55440.1 hypothetical protein [Pseudoruegeria sp. M32A2M]